MPISLTLRSQKVLLSLARLGNLNGVQYNNTPDKFKEGPGGG